MKTVNELMAPVTAQMTADAQLALKTFQDAIREAVAVRGRVPENKDELKDNSSKANEVAQIIRDLDARRLAITKPLRDEVIEQNDLWNKPKEEMQKVVTEIRANNQQYVNALQAKIREEEDKARRIEEGRRKAQETREAKGMDTKPAEAIAPVARPVSLRSQVGVKLIKTHYHDLVEFSQVPTEFLKDDWQRNALDGAKIRSAQAAHAKEVEQAKKDGTEPPAPLVITGLKLWTDEKAY